MVTITGSQTWSTSMLETKESVTNSSIVSRRTKIVISKTITTSNIANSRILITKSRKFKSTIVKTMSRKTKWKSTPKRMTMGKMRQTTKKARKSSKLMDFSSNTCKIEDLSSTTKLTTMKRRTMTVDKIHNSKFLLMPQTRATKQTSTFNLK